MMKNKQYIGLLCCLLCLCMCLAACKGPEPTTTTQPPKDTIYTISVETAGGMTFEGLAVYVYEDNTERQRDCH